MSWNRISGFTLEFISLISFFGDRNTFKSLNLGSNRKRKMNLMSIQNKFQIVSLDYRLFENHHTSSGVLTSIFSRHTTRLIIVIKLITKLHLKCIKILYSVVSRAENIANVSFNSIKKEKMLFADMNFLLEIWWDFFSFDLMSETD